jgi:hypothetical protein
MKKSESADSSQFHATCLTEHEIVQIKARGYKFLGGSFPTIDIYLHLITHLYNFVRKTAEQLRCDE